MFFLIRPVGLKCQLNCGYCYYKDGHDDLQRVSQKRLSVATVQKLLDGLHELPGEHTFCLHGGEPLLIGKKWFSHFADAVSRYNAKHASHAPVTLSVQTNALLVDQEWVELFRMADVGVSVSIDGPSQIHDYARFSKKGGGTHEAVVNRIKMMADSGIRLGAIAVISKKTLELSVGEFYSYFRELPLENGLDFVPYIETGMSRIELEARQYFEPPARQLSAYLKELFDLWLFDRDMAQRIDVRMFEQLVGVALGFIPSLCNLTQGATCGRTPNLMPNGDVYACDLDVLGLDFRMGSVTAERIAEICSASSLKHLHDEITKALEARGCTTCSVAAFCGLTCPRHSFSTRDHGDYCTMIKDLVAHTEKRLNEISDAAFRPTLPFGKDSTVISA